MRLDYYCNTEGNKEIEIITKSVEIQILGRVLITYYLNLTTQSDALWWILKRTTGISENVKAL